jgi:hypothetical protein
LTHSHRRHTRTAQQLPGTAAVHIVNTACDGTGVWLADDLAGRPLAKTQLHTSTVVPSQASLCTHKHMRTKQSMHCIHCWQPPRQAELQNGKRQGRSACASVQHQHSCTRKHRSPPAQPASSMTVALPTHMVTVATAYLKSHRNYYLTYTYSAAAVSQSRHQPCAFCTPTHLIPSSTCVHTAPSLPHMFRFPAGVY